MSSQPKKPAKRPQPQTSNQPKPTPPQKPENHPRKPPPPQTTRSTSPHEPQALTPTACPKSSVNRTEVTRPEIGPHAPKNPSRPKNPGSPAQDASPQTNASFPSSPKTSSTGPKPAASSAPAKGAKTRSKHAACGSLSARFGLRPALLTAVLMTVERRAGSRSARSTLSRPRR